MTHLYLIRHADYIYDWQDGRRRDLGLSPHGAADAARLRDRLLHSHEVNPDIVISSPERGARETAEIVAPTFGLPIVLDADVEEWRSEDGSLSDDEVAKRWGELADEQKPYYRFVAGCESRIEFTLRVQTTLNRIVSEHEAKTVVVFSHGAFIQLSFLHFFGYGEASMGRAVPEISRTSITHWAKAGARWVLKRSNDCHHLSDTAL